MAGQQPDQTGAKILDAAVRVLGDSGFKRATVELVAKEAGVSHMTIYRRWPTKGELLQTAVLREFTGLLDDAFATTEGSETPFADRTVDAFADVVWGVRTHPIVVRELDSETDPVLPAASGALLETVVPLVRERLSGLAAATGSAVEPSAPAQSICVRTFWQPALMSSSRPRIARLRTSSSVHLFLSAACFSIAVRRFPPTSDMREIV